MTAVERIAKHRDLIDLVINHDYMPSGNHDAFMDIANALREINKGGVINTNCSSCIREVFQMAAAHLKSYDAQMSIQKDSLNTFHTFPSHETKKRGRRAK